MAEERSAEQRKIKRETDTHSLLTHAHGPGLAGCLGSALSSLRQLGIGLSQLAAMISQKELLFCTWGRST
jgi:hypothetical protein